VISTPHSIFRKTLDTGPALTRQGPINILAQAQAQALAPDLGQVQVQVAVSHVHLQIVAKVSTKSH